MEGKVFDEALQGWVRKDWKKDQYKGLRADKELAGPNGKPLPGIQPLVTAEYNGKEGERHKVAKKDEQKKKRKKK